MTLPEPTLRHLQRMTDDTSLFEHAIGSLPHRALGYCTDDAGRGLAVAVRSDGRGRRGARRTMARVPGAGARRRRPVPTADGVRPAMDGRPVLRRCLRPSDLRHRRRRRDRALDRTSAARLAVSSSSWRPFRSVYPRATAHAVVGAAELAVADAAVRIRAITRGGRARLAAPRHGRCALAVAGAPARVRERAAARGADRRRPRDRRRRRGGRGAPAAAMAGRRRDARRSLQLHAGRRPRPRRRRVPRSISSRSRRVRSPMPALARSPSRTTTRGWSRSARAPDGSTGRTTWGSRCSIRRRAGASTGWRWTGSIRTRAPSRRSRSSPRCSTRGCWNEVGSAVQRAAWSAASS